jgi:hypothetical protein
VSSKATATRMETGLATSNPAAGSIYASTYGGTTDRCSGPNDTAHIYLYTGGQKHVALNFNLTQTEPAQ